MKEVLLLCACPSAVGGASANVIPNNGGMASVTVSQCEGGMASLPVGHVEGDMASVPVSPKVKEVLPPNVRPCEEIQNSLIIEKCQNVSLQCIDKSVLRPKWIASER